MVALQNKSENLKSFFKAFLNKIYRGIYHIKMSLHSHFIRESL